MLSWVQTSPGQARKQRGGRRRRAGELAVPAEPGAAGERLPGGERKAQFVINFTARRSVLQEQAEGFGSFALLVLGLVRGCEKAFLTCPWRLCPLHEAWSVRVSGGAGRGSAGQGSSRGNDKEKGGRSRSRLGCVKGVFSVLCRLQLLGKVLRAAA